MLCCDCSFFCCIFNDALFFFFFFFCINLEFVKLKTPPAPLHQTARVLSDCEKATASWELCVFSTLPPRMVSDPSGGAFTRSLSAKHYAITNGLYRRQEAGAARTTESTNSNPPSPFSFFPLNPSVSTHELLFWHTQVDKHTHGLSVLFSLCPSLRRSSLATSLCLKDAACRYHSVSD